MLSQSDSRFSCLTDHSNHPDHLSVTRIELFVIPALAVYSSGYRVCLRLSSNKGIGWGEFFAPDTESDIDLQHWSEPLRRFIGTYQNAASLHDALIPNHADSRLCELFSTAVDDLLAHSGNPVPVEGKAEETVLKTRSVAYVSII